MTSTNFAATGSIEQNIIFLMTPTMFGIATGVVTILAGLTSLPRTFLSTSLINDYLALAMPTSRGWLYFHGWSVVIASITLLVLGLKIWTLTLDEKQNILSAFEQTSNSTLIAIEEQVLHTLVECILT